MNNKNATVKVPLRIRVEILSAIFVVLSLLTVGATFKIMTTCLLIFGVVSFYNLYSDLKAMGIGFDNFISDSYDKGKMSSNIIRKIVYYAAPMSCIIGSILFLVLIICAYIIY